MIKLGDFGFAKQIINSETSNSDVRGTNGYVAPEAYDLDAVLKSDVWSLGVSLLELAEGQKPYENQTNEQVDDYCSWVICRRCVLFTMKNLHPSQKANGPLNSLISFTSV